MAMGRETAIRAVVFDIDGTLLDTEGFIAQAVQHALQAHGVTHCSWEYVTDNLSGRTLEDCYKIFVSETDFHSLCREHRAFQERNVGLVRPFPNTDRTLADIHERGVRIAAVTARKAVVIPSLEVNGLLRYFHYIVGGGDVRAPKPDPEGVNRVLDEFCVPSREAVMVGDTVTDIQAGKNAGVATAAALYGYGSSRESLEAECPDYLFNDISELSEIF